MLSWDFSIMQKLPGIFLLSVLFSGALFTSFAFAQEGPIAEDDFYTVASLLLWVPLLATYENESVATEFSFGK